MLLIITKSEYKLLKKIYRKNGLEISNDLTEILENKHLIEHKRIKMNRDGSEEKAKKYTITNAGILAIEETSSLKWSSIRSWIAIAISLIALIFSIISAYF